MSARTAFRIAANLMRERAEAVIECDDGDWYEGHTGGSVFGRWAGDADAAHIASWCPAVALAVAVLLENLADIEHRNHAEMGFSPLDLTDALAVADAYMLADARADAS